MTAIYLDTTKNMTIGLLDGKYNWIQLQSFDDFKSTEGLHLKLLEMLNDSGLKIEEINTLFSAAGPGSYTGMRVSEGIAQILQWQGIKTNSFYHFQIPQILGIKKYAFICKAFKGEFFLKDDQKEILLNLNDLARVVSEYKELGVELFTHYPDKDFPNFSLTTDLISLKGKEIFSYIVRENMLNGPFYFRSLEKEFKVSND
jgi:tRNA threonylcarbamoyladenosine biosynthesis protein TsaB